MSTTGVWCALPLFARFLAVPAVARACRAQDALAVDLIGMVVDHHGFVEVPSGVHRLPVAGDVYTHRGRQRQYPASHKRVQKGHAAFDGERVIGGGQMVLVYRCHLCRDSVDRRFPL